MQSCYSVLVTCLLKGPDLPLLHHQFVYLSTSVVLRAALRFSGTHYAPKEKGPTGFELFTPKQFHHSTCGTLACGKRRTHSIQSAVRDFIHHNLFAKASRILNTLSAWIHHARDPFVHWSLKPPAGRQGAVQTLSINSATVTSNKGFAFSATWQLCDGKAHITPSIVTFISQRRHNWKWLGKASPV